MIENQRIPILVLNDDSGNVDFEHKKAVMNGTYDMILVEKSSFEK